MNHRPNAKKIKVPIKGQEPNEDRPNLEPGDNKALQSRELEESLTDLSTAGDSSLKGKQTLGEKIVEQFEKELAAARKEADDNRDQYLRAKAEMENYKKRLNRTMAEQVQEEKRNLLRKFLTIADNLERAMDHAEARDGLLEGVQLTYCDLQKLLAEEGVEEMETIGQIFDPYYHEAVEVVPTGDGEVDTIVTEVQKGYLYRGQLLRPAKVKVRK
ncbi:MAG: nucleotide exchange factor GrpE [Anaerolineae bacterium]